MRARPRLVIDGVALAAEAVGAERALIYCADPVSAASLRSVLGRGAPLDIPTEVVIVDPAYVAGEETAAVRAIDGGVAKPTEKPPRPFESGVEGKPTAVCNIETLANLPYIARNGPDAYRVAGVASAPGTFLLTLSGAGRRRGLFEVPLGTRLRDVLAPADGADGLRGFLMGGFFGGILSSHAVDLALDYDTMRAAGSGLGCGAIVALGDDECPVAIVAEVMAYLAHSSARQCGPCIRGTAAMRDTLIQLGTGEARPDAVERLAGWSTSLQGRGACAMLDGAADLAGSLLREFPDAVADHRHGGCGVCAARGFEPSLDGATRFAVDIALAGV